jgi:hypothetical protein
MSNEISADQTLRIQAMQLAMQLCVSIGADLVSTAGVIYEFLKGEANE